MEKLLLIFSKNWVNSNLILLNVFYLIILVNFILLNKELTFFTKKDVDKGITPLDVYKLCSSIRETFCLSYSIRKNNNLFLIFQKRSILVKLNGDKLRYLGPDERSQALLLEKALVKGNEEKNVQNKEWKKSTPGIYVRKFPNIYSLISFINSICNGPSFFLINKNQFSEINTNIFDFRESVIKDLDLSSFIIPNYNFLNGEFDVIKLFKGVKNIKFVSLSKIDIVENKILYINFQKDRLELN